MKLTFSPKNLLYTFLVFITEVFIALFIHDNFIRPYVGDILVVFLVFFFLKTFIKTKPFYLAIFTLFFAYFVEFLQHLNIITFLGLQNNKIAKVVIGTTFSWGDLVCYTIGFLIILFIERKTLK